MRVLQPPGGEDHDIFDKRKVSCVKSSNNTNTNPNQYGDSCSTSSDEPPAEAAAGCRLPQVLLPPKARYRPRLDADERLLYHRARLETPENYPPVALKPHRPIESSYQVMRCMYDRPLPDDDETAEREWKEQINLKYRVDERRRSALSSSANIEQVMHPEARTSGSGSEPTRANSAYQDYWQSMRRRPSSSNDSSNIRKVMTYREHGSATGGDNDADDVYAMCGPHPKRRRPTENESKNVSRIFNYQDSTEKDVWHPAVRVAGSENLKTLSTASMTPDDISLARHLYKQRRLLAYRHQHWRSNLFEVRDGLRHLPTAYERLAVGAGIPPSEVYESGSGVSARCKRWRFHDIVDPITGLTIFDASDAEPVDANLMQMSGGCGALGGEGEGGGGGREGGGRGRGGGGGRGETLQPQARTGETDFSRGSSKRRRHWDSVRPCS